MKKILVLLPIVFAVFAGSAHATEADETVARLIKELCLKMAAEQGLPPGNCGSM